MKISVMMVLVGMRSIEIQVMAFLDYFKGNNPKREGAFKPYAHLTAQELPDAYCALVTAARDFRLMYEALSRMEPGLPPYQGLCNVDALATPAALEALRQEAALCRMERAAARARKRHKPRRSRR